MTVQSGLSTNVHERNMVNKNRIKELALIYLVAIIVLLGSISLINLSNSGIQSITGFAVAGNETNETQLDEDIKVIDLSEPIKVIDLSERIDATNETQTIVENETKEKGKPEKEEKEKPEPNTPPVWKADVDELTINGKTTLDLNDYFEDKNNDTIGYAVATSEPDKISIVSDGSLITITPAGDNFESNITIVASDLEKSTTKEIKLIVPERTITIDLEYKSGSIYDADDNGVEATTGIIDLTIENTGFNWDVDENNLCTRWETYSIEEEESTFVCYGSSRCCQFVDLLATRPIWDESFHSALGTYGATFNNIVSSQVLYVDYELAVDEPFAEIYNSEWSDLAASYFIGFYNFENVCVDTCSLDGFNDTSYKLIFEIEDAVLDLDTLTYTLIETIDNVLVSLDVEDSQGITSGSYKLYKDDIEVAVVDNFVEPDYYDIEITPSETIIEKLLIYNVNITEPLTADIGVDDVQREQEIKNVEIIKQYAIDASELDFETATLTATAEATSLFKCKQWDYSTEVCFGTWEKIKDLTVGEEYSLTITADDPGFVEGNINITIVPINITELTLIKSILNITIAKNNNYTIDLKDYFSNIDNNTIFTYNLIDNISIVFENNVATFIPDKDFVGKKFTFITASKGDDSAISNVFIITVTARNLVDCDILRKTDDGNYYCKDNERFYSCSEIDDSGELSRCKEAKFLRDTVDKSMCPFKHKDCNVTVDQEKGWGARQSVQKSNYKLSTFSSNFYCGNGHCKVPFFFKSNASVSGKLDFNVTADLLLENISIKRVLKNGIEVAVGNEVSMNKHDSYYYMAYFDYESEWTASSGIRTTKPLKFNISASLDGEKILEIDPLGFEDYQADTTTDIKDDKLAAIPITCSAGELLILGIVTDSGTIGTHTYNGENFDPINFTGSLLGNHIMEVYNLSDSSSCDDIQHNVDVTVTSNSNNKDAIAFVAVYSGVDTIDETRQVNSSTSATTFSQTITTAAAGDFAVDIVANRDSGGDNLIDATVDNDAFERSPNNGEDSGQLNGGISDDGGLIGGAATMSWTGENAYWTGIGIVLVATPSTADTTPPIINGTINKSLTNIFSGDVINATFNATDNSLNVTNGTIVINNTGINRFFNFSFNTSGQQELSQNFTIVEASGTVVNITGIARDNSSNVAQNETIFTLTSAPAGDSTKPRINASLNISHIILNQVVNMTANVTDDTALDTCQFIINQTGINEFFNQTSPPSGLSDQCSRDFTISVGVGNVINFTVVVNDTSTGTVGGNINQTSQIVTVRDDVPLTNCTTLNTPNTNYTLFGDVNSGATCFYIDAVNITLDCRGYEINYSQSVVGYGINISSQNFTTIKSCDIIRADDGSPLGDSYGVYIFNNVQNSSVYNNTIITFGDVNSYGVYLRTNTYNSTVYNNNITTYGEDGHGVYIAFGSNTNYIYDNNIITHNNNARGVYLFSQIFNTFIYNNNITTLEILAGGILLTADSNSVYNNIIRIGGTKSDGIALFSNPDSNNVYNNTITTNNTLSHGISLSANAFNNNIYDNNITTKNASGSFGIYIGKNAFDNNFSRNTISSLAAGIMINGSTATDTDLTKNNIFTNDTIITCNGASCADNYQDIVLTSNATDITFLNVSFNKSRVAFVPRDLTTPTEINNLTVKWFLDINVTDSSDDTALVGAQVVINDSNSLNLFNGTTDSTGSIPTQTITGYTQNGSAAFDDAVDTCIGVDSHNVTCFTPHNISVNTTGFDPGDLSIDINRSKIKTISLSTSDTTRPRINASLNISHIILNQVVNMTANVTDDTALDTCQFIINQTGINEFFNQTAPPSGTSDECSRDFTISVGVGNVINFTVIVNDTSTDTIGGNIGGNINQTSQIVTVRDDVPLTNCSTLNTPSTNYTLFGDVNSGATCFYIDAVNITLDCRGYEINYSQSVVGYGVNITSQNFTTIKSCDIVQADITSDNSNAYGVYIYKNSSNNTVFNSSVTTYGSSSYGVYLFQATYNNSVHNNSLIATGGSGGLIRLESFVHDNFVYDNTI